MIKTAALKYAASAQSQEIAGQFPHSPRQAGNHRHRRGIQKGGGGAGDGQRWHRHHQPTAGEKHRRRNCPVADAAPVDPVLQQKRNYSYRGNDSQYRQSASPGGGQAFHKLGESQEAGAGLRFRRYFLADGSFLAEGLAAFPVRVALRGVRRDLYRLNYLSMPCMLWWD